MYLRLLIICLFSLPLSAQEYRDYILKVDFGPKPSHEDYWNHWSTLDGTDDIQRDFPHVFTPEGFNMNIFGDCSSSCELRTLYEAPVDSDLPSNLVSDVLSLNAGRMIFKLSELPAGSYDVKFYFHQASSAGSSRYSLALFDARSPDGFTMSTNIRTSFGVENPIISTFTFPLESNGEQVIYINLASNNNSIKINGIEITRYRYRELLSNGIEIIPFRRYPEALITAYLAPTKQLYGCLGYNKEEQLRLGSWSDENAICSEIATDSPEILSDFKLIKFDAYFEWRYSQSVPAVGAVDLTLNETNPQYACLGPESDGIFLAGVVEVKDSPLCKVFYNGEYREYENYWVFSKK